MTITRVDVGVDVAALLASPLTAELVSDTPTTCRSSIGGSP